MKLDNRTEAHPKGPKSKTGKRDNRHKSSNLFKRNRKWDPVFSTIIKIDRTSKSKSSAN